ncbi:VWA domain-containing protein [Streptomyces prasinus]|uniref:VWA domain-containing protein n=1 Tax=Streptomyces prasinus TaxID=67345 RepID=UPI00362B212C
MGILTLLRNAFGRSRKASTVEAEGAAPVAGTDGAEQTARPDAATAATPTPSEPAAESTAAAASAPRVPSPSPEPTPQATKASVPEPRTDEHDLVSAAFDTTTPPATDSPEPKAETHPAPEPTPEAAAETPEPKPATTPDASQPEPEAESNPEPTAKPEPETKPESTAKPEAKAEPETEAEPDSTPEAAPEPQADTASEPEATPDSDSDTEPVAEDEPETKTEPAIVPKAEPEPEPEAKATPKAEPEPAAEATEAQPEAAPEAAPESRPEAADGEDAPQGQPAADDETRTGGAGGNTTEAEGEAEAEVTPRTTPEALRTAYEAAGRALAERGLADARAKVYLVLDRSASMRPYYKDGSAQALAEQTLALAAHLDADPESVTVKVVFFSTEVDGTGELTFADHEDKIDTLHASLGRMGRTSYHAAVAEVLALHDKAAPGTPALVVFQTDGAPDAKTPATQALTEAAKTHSSVFFSFVAFGDPENKAFDYLRKLKTPNTAHFLAGASPLELTDKELYEAVLESWRP